MTGPRKVLTARPGATLLALLLACSPPAPDAPPPGTAADEPCPAGSWRTVPGAECRRPGWTSCPEGFLPDQSGAWCEEILPEASCAPGSMPTVGSSECQPVGWMPPCPEGFEPDPSGWGCLDVLPAAPCSEDRMEVLGSRTCQPMGDCTAPFPPPEASLFVDPAFPEGKLDDAHFRTLTDALRAAPADSVVAVFPGTYRESLAPRAAVRLVGRCPAQVILDGSGLTEPAVRSVNGSKVTLEGLTVRGYGRAVSAGVMGSIVLRRCLVEGSRDVALWAQGPGALIEATGCAIRGTRRESTDPYAAYASGAGEIHLNGSVLADNDEVAVEADLAGKVSLERSVVRGTRHPAGAQQAMGLRLDGSARIEVRQSALVANAQAAAFLARHATGTLRLVETVVRDTHKIETSDFGYGLYLMAGKADLDRVAFVRNEGAAISVSGTTAHLAAKDCVVRETLLEAGQDVGVGLIVNGEGSARLERCALIANSRMAVDVDGYGSSATLEGCLLADTRPSSEGHAMGALVIDEARLELVGTTVARSRVNGVSVADGAGLQGIRVAVLDTDGVGINLQRGVVAVLEESVVAGSVGEGLFLYEEGSALTLARSVVRDTRPAGGQTPGLGLAALGKTQVAVEESAFRDNTGFSILVDGGALKLSRSAVVGTREFAEGNHFGAAVQVQMGGRGLIEDVELRDNVRLGLAVGESSVSVARTRIAGTKRDAEGNGHAVDVYLRSIASLEEVLVEGSEGIGLAFSGSSASVTSCRVADNAVGLHAQGGIRLSIGEEQPQQAAGYSVWVSRDSIFEGNATTLGTGELPLAASYELPIH